MIEDETQGGDGRRKNTRQAITDALIRLMSDRRYAAIRTTDLIQAAGVDLYMAGHWHYYESLYPMGTPPEGTGGPPTQKNFVNPTSTVHITTGNGGPPGKDTMNTPMPALRNKSDKYGYGRVTAYNATHLLFEQVLNGYSDEGEPGEVFDSFVVQQDKHGPFNAL